MELWHIIVRKVHRFGHNAFVWHSRFGHLFVSVNHHRGSHLKDGVYVVDGKVMKDFGYEMAVIRQLEH